MIKREFYLRQIRPFIDKTELVKIVTGARRCGKTSLLESIKQELIDRGVSINNMISINFEYYDSFFLRDAKSLHDYLKSKIHEKREEYISFWMRFRKYLIGKGASTPYVSILMSIFI